MADLKTSVVIDLKGNLLRRSRQYTQSMVNFAQKSRSSNKLLSRSIAATGRGIRRMGNQYTALLGGVATGAAVKNVMNLQERFVRLGIQANVSNEKVNGLKKRIFEVASAPDIRVNASQVTSAIEEIVEKTGDLEFAEKNMRNIGIAIQATGADGSAIGGIMAEFQKMGITSTREVMQALDTLNVQGKEGAFTLQNLAALGPRVVTAYTSLGRTGVGSLREMGAALQVIRQGTGSSEQAATSFEALLRTFGDKAKVAKLEASGIQVFDPDELKKGNEVLRPINQLMKEIIEKTGGKKTLLSNVFDAEAIRAFNAAAAEFQRTGSVESLEKFMNVQANGSTTLRDAARAAGTANAALTNLGTAAGRMADELLAEPIQMAADAINNLMNSGPSLQDRIGGTIDTVLATFGSDAAQRRLDAHFKQQAMAGFNGQLDIKVDSEGRASVTKMKTDNKNINMDVDTGTQMVNP